jgi:OmcA/MtrC family decaheme c-type cytochrome
VRFTVKVDGAPRDITATGLKMGSLRITVAGPTTDYRTYWQGNVQGSGADGTLAAVDAATGTFEYTFPPAKAMPADAQGSYAFGIEGYIQPGGAGGPRYAAFNDVEFAKVTDPAPVARRAVVEMARCNDCHEQLAFHGGSRRNVQYCILCHNSENSNDERIPRLEGADIVAPSTEFRVMIHKIHRGEDLSGPYVLGTRAPTETDPDGAPHDFAETRFPGDLRDCTTCHEAGTYRLPLPDGLLPSRADLIACTEDPGADLDDLCEEFTKTPIYTPPTAAICTSCHDSASTAAHAEIMTTAGGVESCATCHDSGSLLDIDVVHAREP